MNIESRELLKKSKRIVIKVGTSTLTYTTGKMSIARIEKLARVISDLLNQDKEVVLVSSGAIGVGVGMMKMKERPKTIGEKQAVAAVGQCALMHIYSEIFSDYGHTVGQILLTRDIVEDEHRRQNVVNTFENLLKWSIVPIVNENDTVSIEEIKNIKNFGDNDTLSAIVAKLIKADLLIILSDIDGLYDGDPKVNKDSKLISTIREITPQIEEYAGGAGTKRGTGGMKTKIRAAKIATESGVNMIISNGDNPEVINSILNGEMVGSLFISRKDV